ncbi:WxL domain-containing protein [Enterococcus faecalis]|uniref:WxL domain-containing protein n=2 Tax=Enterococcus TaxID=1350 RepID=UPI003F4999CE
MVSSNTGNGRYQVAVNAAVPLPYNFFTNVPTGYAGNLYVIEQLKVDNTLKYVDSIVAPPSLITMTVYRTQQTSEAAQFGNYTQTGLSQRDRTFSKNSASIFSLNTALATDSSGLLSIMKTTYVNTSDPVLVGFDGTPTYRETLNYVVTRKQVTEKFVNTSGVAITPPTGFTQNKKTPMTSNDFTFKQAGTLPDTYTTGGKTYKFKGWYKGKTKPSTLTTTKAPSYPVTYDGNDDLTVMYEEINAFDFPALTFQFGFVNESGQRVDASTIKLAYDTWFGEGNAAGWKTVSIEQGKVAPTKNNLKEIAYPAQSFEIVSGKYSQYSAANLTFTPPRYYEKMSVYNKNGTFDASYPLPNILSNNGPDYMIEGASKNISSWFDLKKSGVQSFIFNRPIGAAPADVQVPAYLREIVEDPNEVNKRGTYYIVDKPIYYYLTNRKVTENFVDTNGAKITPPTGFTQGKQTAITSDPYTFKQAGTLPDTYKVGTKTYKFKGWYKGKTKTEPLKTTKAPSYGVTYDDNDDLNVVYEPVEMADFPALTYQFGFIDESGQRVDATKVGLTYDSWFGEVLTGNVADWKTVSIEKGKVAPTKNNLKEIAYPAQSFEIVSGKSSQYSAANLTFTPPRYYEKMSIYNKNGTFDTDYPLFNVKNNNSPNLIVEDSTKNVSKWFELMKSDTRSFVFNETAPSPADVTVPAYLREVVINPINTTTKSNYYTLDKPVYYYLTNRRVTENFVDTSGAKITPPTGFTQGKQTVINSDPYTFKQAGTLPDTYTTGGKTYKFKGWYKGKTKTEPLTTTKAPSYGVTYDDNDDLNVVYEEETVTTLYPSVDMNFVNEKGGAFTPALTFSGKYYVQSTSDNVINNLYDVTSKNNGNGQYTVSINNGSIPLSQELLKKYNNGLPISSTNRLRFHVDKLTIDQQLKYIDGIQIDTAQSSPLNYYGHKYTSGSSTIFDPNVAPTEYNMTTEQINSLNFSSDGTYFYNANNRFFNINLGYSSSGSSLLLMMALFNENPANQTKLVYKVTRKQVTENFVDANGAKITAPTGFTQGNQVPMNSNTFKYTAAKALPATYTAGGKTYTFQGWYKGKTKPSTLNKTTTPTFNATFDGNDDMTAMYKEEIPTASVTLTRPKEVIDTNTNVIWTTTITNTSKAPLQNLTLKKGPNWSAGLTIPTFMEVTPEGGTTKSIPVTNTLWTEGVPVPNAVPVGKKVSIAFTTRATGRPNTVLKAEVVVFGGIKDSTVDNFVRIRPNDQEVVTPTTEGFISVPTFDFGQVGVAGSKQQHSLKQAADYYGNGTRNPYVRIKKTQPNWSLTAQLSQPKSATDSLPTATRLLLGAAPVSSFTNYNQPTELKNAVGTTSAISLTANNTATSIIANKQFTGSNVYQLDFTFNNVKLEVPANQGVKGQQYKAAVTWNLVTGP